MVNGWFIKLEISLTVVCNNFLSTFFFQEVDQYSNAIANYFYESGIRKGNVVALVMENRPDLAFFWLGLGKIGAVGALINYNLREKALLHCIRAGEAYGIVFTEEMSQGIV